MLSGSSCRVPHCVCSYYVAQALPKVTWRRFMSRCRTLPVRAVKRGSSPWSTGPSSRKGNTSSKRQGSSSSSKKGTKGVSNAPSKVSISSRSSTESSGQGFSPNAQLLKQKAPVHKLTAPLTPQLLDELSGWEAVPTPLWSTFTGHCEGVWLGQYAAYTPWGGDPEPVWADESGAYLMYAYSRTNEARDRVPASTSDATDTAGVAAAAEQLPDTAAASAQTGFTNDADYVDMLVRTTVRSASISSLIGFASAAAAAAATAAGPEAPGTAADDETEGFAYNQDGAVVYNGGSYSVGPELIVAPEIGADELAELLERQAEAAGEDGDEEKSAANAVLSSLPFSTVVFDQALVSSGDARVRLVATLKLRQLPGETELDVEVARLLVYMEHWYGTAESTSNSVGSKNNRQKTLSATAAAAVSQTGSSHQSSSSCGSNVLKLLPSHNFDVAVIDMPRAQPQQLGGTWNVFLVAANPVVEENPDTLQDEVVFAYSSREERQHWHVPGITSSAAVGDMTSNNASNSSHGPKAAAAEQLDDEGTGGSFWLPGNAVATLRMVPVPSSDPSSSKTNGSSGSRGLLIGLHWLVDGGSCVFVERQYDADGQLMEVRHGTAVKGGWSGGRM